MRIALVEPQSSRPNVVLEQFENHALNTPVGLLYLAASVAEHHNIHIVDGHLHRLPSYELAKVVLLGRPDVIGISIGYTTLIRSAQMLAKALKSARPDVIIVAGGNCATFLAEPLCASGNFDVVFMHEADHTFPAFIHCLEDGGTWSTPGIAFRADGNIRVNPFAGYATNLDELPWPRYDLLPERDRYLPTVVSSRGCSFNCFYCSTRAMWRQWRARSPENVVAEVDALYALGYHNRLTFCDDEFLASRPRALRISALLAERNYGLNWGISGRIEFVDDEVLKALSRAGCRFIFFGIESGSDRVRRKLGRRPTVVEVERTIERCNHFGVLPIASFMVGMPFESRDDVLETLSLMRRIATYKVQMSVFTPLIGTPVYQNSAKFGVKLDAVAREHADISIDGGAVVHTTDHLRQEEIHELWLDGQGVAMRRYQERRQYEAAREEILANLKRV